MIKISLVSDNKALSLSMKIALENRAANKCQVTSELEADVGLLFVDSYSKKDWRDIRDMLSFPVILVSLTPIPNEALFLQQPVSLKKMFVLIEKATDGQAINNTVFIKNDISEDIPKLAAIAKAPEIPEKNPSLAKKKVAVKKATVKKVAVKKATVKK